VVEPFDNFLAAAFLVPNQQCRSTLNANFILDVRFTLLRLILRSRED